MREAHRATHQHLKFFFYRAVDWHIKKKTKKNMQRWERFWKSYTTSCHTTQSQYYLSCNTTFPSNRNVQCVSTSIHLPTPTLAFGRLQSTLLQRVRFAPKNADFWTSLVSRGVSYLSFSYLSFLSRHERSCQYNALLQYYINIIIYWLTIPRCDKSLAISLSSLEI